ncbi:hypothetical protein B0T26DRAFT_669576 [Lasiosphaeria miniovina]|uniref:Uncharacterized protein n=1 Tax=Lasiosphaeria miniovina TaxID=1954250 RepID=A0AA40BF66_9PEZI|nr:uncharacterized protein B0T26DRAFT_669576 [Lasiosphaeria miniovina]KAK0733139.1 hypothetical protein B0T26DRAFT_669576 [Lasiosphaeria miniovina]
MANFFSSIRILSFFVFIGCPNEELMTSGTVKQTTSIAALQRPTWAKVIQKALKNQPVLVVYTKEEEYARVNESRVEARRILVDEKKDKCQVVVFDRIPQYAARLGILLFQ